MAIPPGLAISITSTLNNPRFAIHCADRSYLTEQYRFQIIKASYHIPIATLYDESHRDMLRKWKDINFQYHYRRTVIKDVSLSMGSDGMSFEVGGTGILPSRFFLAFVLPDQLNGTYGLNPYKLRRVFKDLGEPDNYIVECYATLNGVRVSSIDTPMERRNNASHFYGMNQTMGFDHSLCENGIELSDYEEDSFVSCFDLT